MRQWSKHRFLVAVMAVLVVVFGCETDDRPEEILTIEQMVPVLTELEIAYAGVDQTIKDPKERTKKYEEMNSLVLKKNKLEKGQFYDSYKWYEQRPILLDTLLKLVVQELSMDLQELEGGGSQPPAQKAPGAK
jgi:hypothetical protein